MAHPDRLLQDLYGHHPDSIDATTLARNLTEKGLSHAQAETAIQSALDRGVLRLDRMLKLKITLE